MIRSKRIAALQGDVQGDPEGGCSLLVSKGVGGKDNQVYFLTINRRIHELNQIKTPFVGWGGRSYQLFLSLHGHLAIGKAAEQHYPGLRTMIVAEFDKSGRLIWQRDLSSLGRPMLVPFHSGYYLIAPLLGGMDVWKYIDSGPAVRK